MKLLQTQNIRSGLEKQKGGEFMKTLEVDKQIKRTYLRKKQLLEQMEELYLSKKEHVPDELRKDAIKVWLGLRDYVDMAEDFFKLF